MKIFIDDERVQLSGPDVVVSLQDHLHELSLRGRYLSVIRVNGRDQTMDELTASAVMLGGEDEVVIYTSSLDELVDETMVTASENLPQIYQGVKETIEAFRVGAIGAATKSLADVSDALQWHGSVLGKLTTLHPGPSDIHALYAELQSVLEMLSASLESEDYVLLADQIEYELMPWLEKWFGLAKLFQKQMTLEKMKAKTFTDMEHQ